MNKAIYNPYTQDQRAQYVQTRKAALALRPDITGAQFDATVRNDFDPQTPENWVYHASQALAAIQGRHSPLDYVNGLLVSKVDGSTALSDYFGAVK